MAQHISRNKVTKAAKYTPYGVGKRYVNGGTLPAPISGVDTLNQVLQGLLWVKDIAVVFYANALGSSAVTTLTPFLPYKKDFAAALAEEVNHANLFRYKLNGRGPGSYNQDVTGNYVYFPPNTFDGTINTWQVGPGFAFNGIATLGLTSILAAVEALEIATLDAATQQLAYSAFLSGFNSHKLPYVPVSAYVGANELVAAVAGIDFSHFDVGFSLDVDVVNLATYPGYYDYYTLDSEEFIGTFDSIGSGLYPALDAIQLFTVPGHITSVNSPFGVVSNSTWTRYPVTTAFQAAAGLLDPTITDTEKFF